MADRAVLTDPGMTLDGALAYIVHELNEAGITNAAHEARQLLIDATTLLREDLISQPQMVLEQHQRSCVADWLKRRVSGEPLARIRGWQDFYGRRFYLSPATLEPRPDSETLIDAALQIMNKKQAPTYPWRVLDIGTGTGCLALTLLAEFPNATAVAVDISSDALEAAQQNATSLNVSKRATYLQSNYLEKVDGTFDVLISNPPYIKSKDISTLQVEVLQHDPHIALNGGVDGLDAYRCIGHGLQRVIPQGLVIVETACNDAARVIKALSSSQDPEQLNITGVWQDFAGCERCVALETFS